MSRRLLALLVLSGAVAVTGAAQSAAEKPVRLEEFIVTPSRFGVAEQGAGVAATLTSKELETLPQVGADLFRSIARLPGLAADDFSAQFWVRGAPNRELLARLDGLDLVEPFHLKDIDGALSILDPQMISRLELVTGGFGADYGDRLAGVLTMETKWPSVRRDSLGLSLTGVGGSTAGTFAGGQGRWLAGARRGYPDVALKVAGRSDDIDPRYYDLTGKVEWTLAPGHTLSLHGLYAGDSFRYQRKNDPTLRSGYDSGYAWLRWRGTWSEGVASETVLSGAWLTWERRGSGLLDGYPFALRDDRSLDLATLRQDWSVRLDPQMLVRFGVEAARGAADYAYALSRQQTVVTAGRQTVAMITTNAAVAPEGVRTGAFVAGRWQPFAGLVVEPSLRMDRRDLPRVRATDPRFNAAWSLGGGTLRAAWGLYAQAQGWHELRVADGETAFGRTERAEQRVLGYEHPLGRGLVLRGELYQRDSWSLRPRWENLDNPYDLFPEAQSDRVRLAPSNGRARGVELLLAGRPRPEVAWNVSYALAEAREKVAGSWISRAREQRHTFQADVTWLPNPRWQFSTAWQFHSGWPTTDVVYSLASLSNGRRLLVSVNGAPYSLRLPAYHRLDFRVTRRFPTKRGEVRVFLDVFNAYNRVNQIGYVHQVSVSGTQVTDVRKPREQLPLLPSVGISWER